MTIIATPTEVQPIAWESIAATAVIREGSCSRKLVLERTLRGSLLPVQHPYAILGKIAHSFLEGLMAPGAKRDDAGIDQAWMSAVSSLEVKAKSDSDERDWVPFAESIRELERIRLRALRQARVLPPALPMSPSSTGGGGPRRLGAEVPVAVSAGLTMIRGSIDLVHELNGVLQLEDWKTGSALDQMSGEVKPEYRNQLDLYAGMYREVFEQFPERLVLRPFVGQEHAWKSTLERSIELLEIARTRATDLHNGQRAIRTIKDFDQIEATPDRNGNCSDCRARPHCSTYLSDVLGKEAPVVPLGDEVWSKFDLKGFTGDPIRCNKVTTVPITDNGRTVYLRCPDSGDFSETIVAKQPIHVFGAVNGSWASSDNNVSPAEFILPKTGRVAVDL